MYWVKRCLHILLRENERMKSLQCLTIIVALLFTFTGFAFADQGGFYGSIKVGGSYLDADKSTSGNATGTSSSSKFDKEAGTIGFAAGYDWMGYEYPIRTEIEYMYTGDFKYKYSDSNSSLTDTISLQTVMLNVYWDFYNSTDFTPFINGGVGVAWVEESFSTSTISDPGSKTSTNLAFNLGAGVGWSITESIILDLAYRYDYYGDGEKVTGTSTDVNVESQVKDIGTHKVLLGLRYQF